MYIYIYIYMNYIKEITLYVKTNVDTAESNNNNDDNKPETEPDNENSALNISNEGYVPLTHSMIVQPPPPDGAKPPPKSSFKYNQTPYFTNYVLYSSSLKSYLLEKGYEEIQKFFFNQSHFRTVLQNVGIYVDPSMKEADRNRNSLPNIEFMISLLFPTSFPAYNNIISSYDTIFKGSATASTSNTMTLYDYLPKYVKEAVSVPNNYSYIKIGGSVHTIYRVVVINDIINHPKYNLLMNKVHTFFEDFDKERDDVIASLISKFVRIRDVLEFLEGDLQYLHILLRAKKGQLQSMTGFEYWSLNTDFTKIGMFKENRSAGFELVNDETMKKILTPIFKENNYTTFFGKFKKALGEIVKYSYDLSEYSLRQETNVSNENQRYQENVKPLSDSEVSKIKEYLKYYEIFEKYYQYDANYSKMNVPILKNIFYNSGRKKKDEDERYSDSYYYRRRQDKTFEVEKEAKEILQSSKSMTNYQGIFETFKAFAFDKVVTDNTELNAILRTYVNVDVSPDNFLLYLYQFLSLLKPKQDTTLQRVLMDDDVLKKKEGDIEKYCKMTVLNTMEKKGEKKKVSVGKYSVYLRMDLISGKLDDTNVSNIQCNYTGEQLGNMYLKMLVPQEYWEIKPLPYLKLDSILDKTKAPKAPTKAKSKPITVPTQTKRKRVNKRGGNRRTARNRRFPRAPSSSTSL